MSARKKAALEALQGSSYSELENADPDGWRKDVPNVLFPAVVAVRTQFGKAVVGDWALITKELCNARLRNPDQDQEERIVFPEGLRVTELALARFHRLLQQRTCPAIFKAFLDLYLEGLAEPTLRSFAHLQKIISRANPSSVSDPVSWIDCQARHLVRSHRWDIHAWIIGACDRSDLLTPRAALLEALREPGSVPELIRMKPAGIFPYDASQIWNPLAERSLYFTALRADDYVRRMDEAIEDAGAQMRIDLHPHSPTMTVPGPAKRKAATKKTISDKSKAIRQIIEAGYEGQEFARQMDRRGVQVPPGWTKNGGPATFQIAYALGNPYRQRISTMKSKVSPKKAKSEGVSTWSGDR